jgi:NADPH:quinone reductase-like Zn-dependent oxidoreductase
MMKAVRIHGYNEQPTVEEVDTPAVGDTDVLVRVAAAALNPLDTQMQTGKMHGFFPVEFPYTIGTDLAGTIEQVGVGVTGWSVGDRVVVRTDPPRGGAMAEFAVVPASYLVKMSGSASFEQAAAVPTAAGTAYQALHEVAGLKAGQTLLVHAGAGGVGSSAIQIARQAGARVVATASGDGLEIARRLGANQVIDYQSERFEDKVADVDVVLDTIGGDTQQRSFDVLRAGGYLAATTAPPDEALAKAHGVNASFVFHGSDAARLGKVIDLLGAGALTMLVDRTAPLAAFDAAFQHQASGRARGKIIVTM